MAAGDTLQGLTVEIDGVAVAQVMDATRTNSVVTVDCTCLDDASTDNRAGTLNPTGTLTVSFKDSASNTITEGDTVTLAVGNLTATNMLVESVEEGGGTNAPNTYRLSLVSTLKAT